MLRPLVEVVPRPSVDYIPNLASVWQTLSTLEDPSLLDAFFGEKSALVHTFTNACSTLWPLALEIQMLTLRFDCMCRPS